MKKKVVSDSDLVFEKAKPDDSVVPRTRQKRHAAAKAAMDPKELRRLVQRTKLSHHPDIVDLGKEGSDVQDPVVALTK